ncbi:helix-turn-helix domain-containing protein [Leuconostoc litchii]|uniref:LexA family transcriptional regulator n=1 Tax=Leuconostoc litchii TaxID=1981069 RepID=A0A6P2CLA2_9LACO|nr:S24 family peptidase [Leuconostoc litchii]TYC46828.1 LexA family transcriptional regulator [Leuconostoc litchii]GMA70722.1 helix-turn-helix domain-containing protein [Leuconostoc litchii]GMA70792.1 helix-turn-helix domain-containing protein [Leuconostoc litchii]
MESFNSRLKTAMEYKNIKPADLSKMTGIGKSSISQWLSGKYSAKQDKIFIVAKALNVNPSWLIGADVPMNDETVLDRIYNVSNKLNKNRQEKVYDFAKQQYNEQNNIVELPLIKEVEISGAVSAGTGEYLGDGHKEIVSYNGDVPVHDFAVVVNGDSMLPLFDDKQIIFVKKTTEVRSGQIVIADYDQQAFVKKYVSDESGSRFVSLNKKYDDMTIDENHESSIFGVVVL